MRFPFGVREKARKRESEKARKRELEPREIGDAAYAMQPRLILRLRASIREVQGPAREGISRNSLGGPVLTFRGIGKNI